MRIRSLEERVQSVALANDIIMNMDQGLTQFCPGVMIFYGVKRDRNLVAFGMGKQDRYLALLGEHISIQHYENQITFRSTP